MSSPLISKTNSHTQDSRFILARISDPKSDFICPEIIEKVLHYGGAQIIGPSETTVIEHLKQIRPIFESQNLNLDSFPENPVRGKFVQKLGSDRRGLNYGPELNGHFESKQDMIAFENAYFALQAIAETVWKELFIALKIPLKRNKAPECQILTSSYYTQENLDQLGLSAHEDFGLATIGVSDQPGLSFQTPEQNWHSPQPYEVLFHIGQWGRRILKENGYSCAPFVHRVTQQKQGRFFLGMFTNPSFGETLESNFFSEKREKLSFVEFLKRSSTY